jgi:hypothetical protein
MEVVMPGAISTATKDKIVMIILAIGILITVFAATTNGLFR